MKFVVYLLRLAPWKTLGAIVVGAIGGLSGSLLMALINSRLDPDHVPSRWTSALGFSVVILVLLVTGFLSRLLMSGITEKVGYEMRLSLCRQILGSPLRQLESEGFAKILAILTQDVNSLTTALLQLPVMCINLTIVMGCFAYLGWLSQQALGVLVIFMILAVISAKVSERPADLLMEKARDEFSRLVGHFRSLTDGIKELKLNRRRRSDFYLGSLEATADSHRRYLVASLRIHAATNSWVQGIYFVLIAFLLYGLRSFVDVKLSVLTGYTLTALYMRGPFIQLIDVRPIFARASIALRNIEELGLSMTIDKSVWQSLDDDRGSPKVDCIELRGVTHSYFREREERDFTLGPIDLVLNAGEIVFLIGGNGSGKTTLAKLITGLYPPGEGMVLLNDEVVDDDNREHYRQCFSAIFGDFHLFEGLLKPPAGDLAATARDLLVKLHLDHKVTVENGILSTTQLSQGQRKRLALLNAYLEDRPVYVFDEWAADQDPEFREIFYRILLPELRSRGKAVLVISHDDRYYHLGDRVVKLDSGKLLAEKTEPRARALGWVPVAPETA